MKSIKRNKRGFTLIEVMITVALMSIVGLGTLRLFNDGLYMWNFGTARMTLNAEARIAMAAITKFIHNCQGATIRISRLSDKMPANSYISANIVETIFITTTEAKCGCSSRNNLMTFGSAGEPMAIYQNGNYLCATFPQLLPGTDLTNFDEIEANVYYQTVTLSANVESLLFNFVDSEKSRTVITGIRLSKKVVNNKPPINIFLKKAIVVRHFHSGGYYYND